MKILPTNNEYIYKITTQYKNIPLQPDRILNEEKYRKIFFQGGTIKCLDIGFHYGKCLNSDKEYDTNLSILHFHNKLYKDTLEAAKEKMKLRVDINNKNALQNYKGNGHHLIKILLQSEENYYEQFKDTKFIYEPKFRKQLNDYDISINF